MAEAAYRHPQRRSHGLRVDRGKAAQEIDVSVAVGDYISDMASSLHRTRPWKASISTSTHAPTTSMKSKDELLTSKEEPARLVSMKLFRKVSTIPVQYRLTPLKKRYLQVEVLQDLDQGGFEAWNFETVLDASDETDWIDLSSNVLEKATDESCDSVKDESAGDKGDGREGEGKQM